MITITRPFIEQSDASGQYYRLCSDVRVDGDTHHIWYEVEKEYAQYLCVEKADAFLIGILPFAMAFGHDIQIDGCPISEKLYYQMKHIYLAALGKYSDYYKQIEIEAELTDLVFDSYAVGTGFSAGVDSFYTLLKNTKEKTKNFNITHLTFFNVGACGSYGGKEAEARFHKRIGLYDSFVKELGVKFVKVNSNISEILMMSYNFTHTFRSLSAVLALQKLFKTYYYSAGFTLKEFCFNPYDSAYFDLLNMQCFSTENTAFYTTGTVETRIEKLQYIARFPETYGLLNVCNINDENCRTCEKCIRTMAELYSIGALEKYAPVFDVPYFKEHLVKNFAFVIAKRKDGTAEAMFFRDVIATAKKNGIKIPFAAHFAAIPMSIKFRAIAIARKSKVLKRWWHRRIHAESGIRFADVE